MVKNCWLDRIEELDLAYFRNRLFNPFDFRHSQFDLRQELSEMMAREIVAEFDRGTIKSVETMAIKEWGQT